ncbi:OmpA family protein [Methylomicrobium sp. Wu6]|uniref:OmpA family protein n=1 Tax=Methylomicrobium sp. Wu6 TaxID=3107928 RepID=UPI002DD6356B|nr:OmpA family protein [Methylomicrobium sp. Wu6]MEC4750482.1 OmpA family protein [Methylomicrobium sp. Wu6]
MNRQYFYLPCVVFAAALAGCTTPPHKDIPLLTSEVDAVVGGDYGQSIYHEELAEEKLEEANNVLNHWKNDHYWNIEEGQRGVDAARAASQHRLESEKALCQWLTAVHSPNHHMYEVAKHDAAYFKTGSAVPYSTDHHAISAMASYLQAHPDAFADVTAYTDTVGSAASNQNLAERRAETVTKLLVEHGAKAEQLRVKAAGEAEGPDNMPDQHHRVVVMSTDHPKYQDCAGLK